MLRIKTHRSTRGRVIPGVLLTALLLPLLVNGQEHADDCVILLHGLGRSDLSMKALEWRMEKEGYLVVNQDYPSTQHPIGKLAEIALTESLAACENHSTHKIHFVTHSLGGILLRQYLEESKIENLGRAVMLGPPNQGSQLADFIQGIGFTSNLQPAAVRQLGTNDVSVPRSLGPVEFEVGVIAGNHNLRPFTSHSIDSPSDGTVTVEETKVAGMTDFIELKVTHTLMMWQDVVLDQAVYFLANGTFEHDESSDSVSENNTK